MHRKEFHSCGVCFNFVKKYKTRSGVKKFCSHRCASEHKSLYKKENRSCLTCKAPFIYNKKPFSNNSGVYCSMGCRNDGYVKNHVLRSRWKSTRDKLIKSYGPNCSLCWSNKNIEVHHIIPLRRGGSDNPLNLVVLCHKCHAREEIKSKKINPVQALMLAAEYAESWLYNKGMETLHASN